MVAARDFVTDFDPELVVTFAPDHYNGFFYRAMPPFCIGTAATGVGDYGTYKGLRSVMLRYFNAAGADPEGRIGEWHSPETHAVPLAIEAALGRRDGFKVFGSDYDTRDGTCVRDYIHVLDLADAHVRAVDYLLGGGQTVELNLGTGTGTTVKELLAAISAVSGKPFPVEYVGRRDGDSTSLVADNARAREVLGWEPRYGLGDIIGSAWKWHSRTNSGAGR